MKYIVTITQKTTSDQFICAAYVKDTELEAMAMYHAEMTGGYTAVSNGTLEFETVVITTEQGGFILSDSTLRHTQISMPTSEITE